MCVGPAPAHFMLTESLKPGACAIRVGEDFLDAPRGTNCLLIESLYVVVAPREPMPSSSVLLLHVRSRSRDHHHVRPVCSWTSAARVCCLSPGLIHQQSDEQVNGQLWIVDCIFQGSGRNGRAIGVNTLNGGDSAPMLYIKGAVTTCWARVTPVH